MLKINKKGKIFIGLFAFLLLTPLTIFYLLDGSGVFDTRSQAGDDGQLSEEYKRADLNADGKITIADFGIWLSHYRSFKSSSTSYSAMSDLNDDGVVSITDFAIWLNLWRKYKGDNPPVPEAPIIGAIGGEVLNASDGYTYHTFKGDGTFTPGSRMKVEVLIVGGGGGGGADTGGGGGAGGLRVLKDLEVFEAVPVVIGAGGSVGMNGGDSKFWDQVSLGGGGGGSGSHASNFAYYSKNGRIGGSGGGGADAYNNYVAPGTAGQGNAGAKGILGPSVNGSDSDFHRYGGGGGGAGDRSASMNGGIGVQIWGKWYAGGGGGGKAQSHTPGSYGVGGQGGGGTAPAGKGTDGLGGGGAGGGYKGEGGVGGSGIVIVRYPTPK